jgi:hypothetical protein
MHCVPSELRIIVGQNSSAPFYSNRIGHHPSTAFSKAVAFATLPVAFNRLRAILMASTRCDCEVGLHTQAKKLADALGGVDQARAALDVLAKLM